jgi:phosphoribosylformimino-5-aminoimidazole carboxamide ribotide isomerase
MHILPVLDLMFGQVVRGIGGRRSEYRPIVSRLAPSSEPAAVAAAFAEQFGFSEFYLADLDAIGGASPAWHIYSHLHARGHRLWVDAGIRNLDQARELGRAGVKRVVIGLETIAGPEVLAAAVNDLRESAVFSLDLREGQPLGNVSAWPSGSAEGIATLAVELGVRRIIVLDLASVGGRAGIGTLDLCGWLAKSQPQVEIYAGGGVRDVNDLRQLRDAEVRGALVASALHDGKLSPDDLAGL